MCSTYNLNHSTNGDKDGGGYGSGGVYPKKQKRQKVAKRGPGVAELEKILREQEQENEGFSLVPSFSNSYQPSSCNVLPPSSNSSWKNIPFGLKPNHCDTSSKPGRLILSDPKLMPKMWMSREASGVKEEGSRSACKLPFPFCSRNGSNGDHNEMSHFSSLKGKDQSYPQRSCVFSDLPELKVSSSSSMPPDSGQSHGLEPPSNQTSAHHFTFLLPEEKKDGSRISPQIYKGIPLFPPFCHQVPTFPSVACKSKDNSFHIEPTETTSRNAESGCYYVPNFRNRDTNCGIPDDKLLLLGSSATPRWNASTYHQEESKLNSLSFQEEHMDESQSRPRLKTECQNTFISFLLPEDHVETVSEKCFRSSNEKVETNPEGIDLDLRL